MKTKADSGRKGGTITLERYGRDQLAAWGRLGGRPRSRTYTDITTDNTKCRFCHQPLIRSRFNNRYYVDVCNNPRCYLSRQPQRNVTYTENRQRQLLEQRNNHKEAKGLPGNVSELKRVFKLRGRSSPSAESEPAGMAQETPREPALPERAQR